MALCGCVRASEPGSHHAYNLVAPLRGALVDAPGPSPAPPLHVARSLCQQLAQVSASSAEQRSDAYFDQCMIAHSERSQSAGRQRLPPPAGARSPAGTCGTGDCGRACLVVGRVDVGQPCADGNRCSPRTTEFSLRRHPGCRELIVFVAWSALQGVHSCVHCQIPGSVLLQCLDRFERYRNILGRNSQKPPFDSRRRLQWPASALYFGGSCWRWRRDVIRLRAGLVGVCKAWIIDWVGRPGARWARSRRFFRSTWNWAGCCAHEVQPTCVKVPVQTVPLVGTLGFETKVDWSESPYWV
jgi:hypothetical protein